ncbi:MAG: hypothetical protein ACXVPE_14330, partial [Bacteroidia bacterium]
MSNTNWATGFNKLKGFSAVSQLLLINGVVFLLGNISYHLFHFPVLNYLMLPARMSDLATHFYTPFTY